MKTIGAGKNYHQIRKGQIFGAVLCIVLALLGFLLPFFFYTRSREALCITISFLCLLGFGNIAVGFLILARQNRLRLSLLATWEEGNSLSVIEGDITSIEKHLLRKEVPTLAIQINNITYFACLLFDFPSFSIGQHVRFEVNDENIILGYEVKA